MENFENLRNFKPELKDFNIPDATKGTRRPYFDVGEYLPKLQDGEIEIARINLASSTGDVFSFRIKKERDNYFVSIADEYETEFFDYKNVYDSIPSQGEILDIITEMNNEKDSQPYWLAIIEQNGFESVEEITDFMQFDSNVYPNLNELFVDYLVENGFSYDEEAAKVIDDDVLAELIKSHKMRNDWDSLMGTICFNVWHNSNESFLKYQNLEYINISFLYSLNLFQKWDKIYLSKKFDLDSISKDASPFVVNMSSKLLDSVPRLKEFVGLMNESNSRLTIINFITVFAGELSENPEFRKENINPLDYFQKGVEVLCLFTNKLQSIDKDFYNDLMVLGKIDEKVEDLIQQINSLQDSEA
jgi:hypothetical protein